MPDKLNHVDYHWYVVRTRPHQESKLAALLEKQKLKTGNILEVYAPTHTTVNVRRDGADRQTPLFAGIVFVLATQNTLVDFMKEHPQEGDVLYERKKEKGGKTRMWVIPEEQMRAFKDYNENYADKVVVLERPYTDYAFNTKANEPNEIVRVVDGPLAGCEGYICRFRRDKRLVFQVRSFEPGSYLAVSYPNVWDLHVVRLHNTECDRMSVGTEKGRAVDILTGFLQACGYADRTRSMLYDIVDSLVLKPSLTDLCKDLYTEGDTALSKLLAQMTGKEAELIINLVRYEHDNPGYVRRTYQKLLLRPFLTPTSGVKMKDGKTEAELQHNDFTEIIRKIDITEEVYYPSKGKGGRVTTTYYAHIGILRHKETDGYVIFANWDDFLSEYFLTTGKANEKLVSGTVQNQADVSDEKKEKLIDSFRNYAPALYKVLTDAGSRVKAVRDFRIGNETLNVLAVTATADGIDTAVYVLTETCVNICKEINTTTHLAIWRRYLRTVWLHW